MDRELVLALAHILLITTWLIRISTILLVVIFIWEMISRCSVKSMIAQITISVIIFLIEAVRFVVEICTGLNATITLIIMIVIVVNIFTRIFLIRHEKETS